MKLLLKIAPKAIMALAAFALVAGNVNAANPAQDNALNYLDWPGPYLYAGFARKEGASMAGSHYTSTMAQQFLFAEARSKYHDRFFTRAYVEEGIAAFKAENGN